MIGRGLAAVFVGVLAAAVVNSLLLVIVSGESIRSVGGVLAGMALFTAVGIFITVPSWLMFCLIFLPVVTHRVRLGRSLKLQTYLLAAAGLGALLIIPVFAWLGELGRESWIMPVWGGIGGLSIALMWRLLILDVISPPQASGAFRA